MAPTASPTIMSASWIPKIRARISDPTLRWSNVRPVTRVNAMPASQAASMTATTTGEAVRPISTKGTPVAAMPNASAGVSLRRPMRTTVAAPPITAPTPSADVKSPGPESPSPNVSRARTTMRMSSIPMITLCPATRSTSMAAPASWLISRNPSAAEATIPSRPDVTSALATRSLTVSAAATASPAAITRNTAPGPHTPINTPASAGPRKPASPSTVPVAEFPAVSSPGVSAMSGRMALWTGRVSVTAEAASAALTAHTAKGASATSAIPVAAMVTD